MCLQLLVAIFASTRGPLLGMEASAKENRPVLLGKKGQAVPEAGSLADEGQGADVSVGS